MHQCGLTVVGGWVKKAWRSLKSQGPAVTDYPTCRASSWGEGSPAQRRVGSFPSAIGICPQQKSKLRRFNMKEERKPHLPCTGPDTWKLELAICFASIQQPATSHPHTGTQPVCCMLLPDNARSLEYCSPSVISIKCMPALSSGHTHAGHRARQKLAATKAPNFIQEWGVATIEGWCRGQEVPPALTDHW